MLFSVDNVVFLKIPELLGQHLLRDLGHEASEFSKAAGVGSRQMPYYQRDPFPGEDFKRNLKFMCVAAAAYFVCSILRHLSSLSFEFHFVKL